MQSCAVNCQSRGEKKSISRQTHPAASQLPTAPGQDPAKSSRVERWRSGVIALTRSGPILPVPGGEGMPVRLVGVSFLVLGFYRALTHQAACYLCFFHNEWSRGVMTCRVPGRRNSGQSSHGIPVSVTARFSPIRQECCSPVLVSGAFLGLGSLRRGVIRVCVCVCVHWARNMAGARARNTGGRE